MTSVVDSFLSAFAHLNYDLGFMLSVVIITSGIIIFTIMALNAMVAVYFETNSLSPTSKLGSIDEEGI